MRSIILTVVAAFALLLGVLILFPSTVVPTKSVVAAFSGICVARTVVCPMPVFYLSPCDDTIRRVLFEKVGRTIPCDDCAKHDLYLPP